MRGRGEEQSRGGASALCEVGRHRAVVFARSEPYNTKVLYRSQLLYAG